MKTAKTIAVVCWGVSAIALAGLALWFLTGSPFSVTGFGWEINTGPYELAGTYTVPAENLDSLHVDWISSDLSVMPYDGTEITLMEYAQRELRDDEKLNYSASGGTLTVNFCDNGILRRIPQKKLEVLLPRELCEDLKKLSLETTAGVINASGFNAQSADAESTSGKVQLSGFTAYDLRCETTSGAIEIVSGDTEKLTLSTTSGRIDVSDCKSKSLDCETTSGSVSVTVPSNSEVTVHHSSTSGKFSSEVPVIMQNRDAQFSFETTSGSVKIYTLD